MITELIVGDRVLIDGEPYYINQVQNDDMGIYEARNISKNIVQVNIKDIGRYIHIDEEYNTIVRNMDEVMTQDIITENKNYCYRYGILNNRLYRLTAYRGSHDYWKTVWLHTASPRKYIQILTMTMKNTSWQIIVYSGSEPVSTAMAKS